MAEQHKEQARTLSRAEAQASTLPPLLVAAERVAATVAAGTHGRRRVGPGETFWQFRRYQPGDPVQSIDWRQSARSDPIFVRETEWALAQSVWLWRDRSPSMAWRSHPDLPEKGERADLLLLALGSLLVRGGERIGLLGGPERPSTGRTALTRIALALGDAPSSEDGLPKGTDLPRHAQLVLLGDFLSPLEDVDAALRGLAGRGVKGHLLQVLDPAEESLPFSGRVRFAGLEGEGHTLVRRVEDVRDAYAKRLAGHREGLRAIARTLGWSFTLHHTDQPPQAALLALHAVLSEV
nr:DUF58 domain-containing protein [Telmatospirillum sp. J64-1]